MLRIRLKSTLFATLLLTGVVLSAKAEDLAWKNLDNLGLQVEVPASAEFLDTSADAPGGQYATPDAACKVRVNQTTIAFTDDFDTAKSQIEKDPGSKFKSWTKSEKTTDGWHFEWQSEDLFEPGKFLHGVQIRRAFGDKQVECWEKASSPEAAACTVHACQSLKGV